MLTATRTFRVFVSSTFEDLKAERDALQRDVFPKLRKLCEEIGARFQAIDLRWGVRDEAALDQQTLEICLREIERCQQTGIKPNFIVLLGHRYGWRPLPERIEADEFERVRDLVASAADQQRTKDWYERDDNAVPPEYLLKPRTGEFVDKDRWEAIEQDLHRILREGARNAGLTREKLIKYGVSATHQEILKGLGATEEDRKHVFAFFRDPAPVITEDSDLTALKQDLREKLDNENIHSFSAADLAKLCADVEDLLKQVILAETGRFKSRPALDLEIHAHETFASERARHFTGRKTVLDAIDAHFQSGESRPLVVHGPSGCGKSAIIAKASEQAKAKMPGVVLIQRFIGVTPDASNGLTLLRSLCEQLSREYGVSEETPLGFQPLVVAFHDRMARATEERPLVLFLDALDQLRANDEVHSFTWLRQTLPQHVSLVASATEIPAGLKNASQVAVEDFPVDDAAEVLAAWLEDAKPKRKLQPEQRQKVLSGFAQSKLPLYLKLAFEEARRWPSFNTAETCVLGGDVGGMIEVLFDRLSQESNHGPLLVNRSLGFLAAARYGLTEDEMLDVLSADDDVWQDFKSRAHHTPPARQLPVIVWSRLYLDIEPYLNERSVPGGNVMAFYHRQVAERAVWVYLRGQEGPVRHAALAKYFGEQQHWRNKTAMQANERKITELVQQQVGANALAEMETILTDIDFIAAKCAAGLIADLQLDYRDAIAALPEAQPQLKDDAQRQAETALWTKEIINYAQHWSVGRDRLERGETIVEPEPKLPEPVRSKELWTEERIEQEAERIRTDPTRLDRLQALQRFIQQEISPLQQFGRRSGFVVQHAYNHAPLGPAHEAATRAMPAVAAPLLTRHWVVRDRYNPKPALLRTLEGHDTSVNSVSVTADGRRAVSGSGDAPKRLWDLRVWDLETGECLHVLEGHTDRITSVSVTPDGRRAVSGSYDKTLRVWDLESGQCLRMLEGHTNIVTRVSVTPDGRRAVSKGNGTLRVWDLESGECLRVLEGHGFNSASVTPDGRRAVAGSLDNTLRVWDLESGECLHVLEGHTDRITSVSVTPDGRRAVSGSLDGTLRVWDLESEECLRVLEGISGPESLSVTADGRRVLSGSLENTVRVWDLESGQRLRTLEGHSFWVTSVSVTADGRRAVSGSRDNTVRVWDLEIGQCLPVLEGHRGSVESVSVTPDGRRAVSGSHDKKVRVWDLESGECLRVLEGYGYEFESVSVTPDGRRALSGSWDLMLRVWDLESGQCLHTLEGHTDLVASLSATANGRRAVSGSYDNTVRVWDLETGECLHLLEGHSNTVTGVSVTADGRRAVSGSYDNTLRVWDLETGQCLRVLEGNCKGVTTVSVTADGRRAVSGNGDHTLSAWDLETGECLRLLEGHGGWVRSVSVTADGRRAVSGSWDKTMRMWDLATGTCLAVARAPAPVNAVSVSSVLGRMFVGTSTGEVLQFDLRGITLTVSSLVT